jgi:hypothetical protein
LANHHGLRHASSACLLNVVVAPLMTGAGRSSLVNDDTPTWRYGPCIQAAGFH